MLRPPSEISMTANIKVAERKCYINGQFVGSGRQFAKINPVDGTVVAQVHEADPWHADCPASLQVRQMQLLEIREQR